jgi:hypothetical protein
MKEVKDGLESDMHVRLWAFSEEIEDRCFCETCKAVRERNAAALFNACKKCEKMLLDIGDPFRGDHWDMMQDIRAAIAEAKGERK